MIFNNDNNNVDLKKKKIDLFYRRRKTTIFDQKRALSQNRTKLGPGTLEIPNQRPQKHKVPSIATIIMSI